MKDFTVPEEALAPYRPLPFWSWNDTLNEEELITQIRWLKDAGCGGFFMHARPGLATPYLGEDWMRCIRASAEEAKKLGLTAWVYDENGWPSGFADGKLLADEANHDGYLTHSVGEYDPGAYCSYSLAGEKLERITAPRPGEALNVYLHISPSSVDILQKRVAEGFIAETHKKYEEEFGSEFPRLISGFFTDEPQYYRNALAFSRALPDAYKARYGGDVLDELGLLFAEKEGYRAFRYRYWLTMQRLMEENFGKTLYDYHESRGISLIGHYVDETSLAGQMTCCAGIMPLYKYEHVPGIDWLGRSPVTTAEVKQVASAAAQYGRRRVITESFAACGWSVTPWELKYIVDSEFVYGANLLCHHLVPVGERGERKRDFPAHFSGINPWAEEFFGEFNDYAARLGCFIGETNETVDVAMLSPIRSAYFGYRYTPADGFGVGELDEGFRAAEKLLEDNLIPFHLLSESLLEEDGFAEGGRIGCGRMSYRYLVLPPVYTLSADTARLIGDFLRSGGKLLLLGEKPRYLEGEEHQFPDIRSNCTLEELKALLPFSVLGDTENVRFTLREKDGKTLFFLVNCDTGREKEIAFTFKPPFAAFRAIDLAGGTVGDPRDKVTLRPRETLLAELCGESPADAPERVIVTLPDKSEVLSPTENYLPLDRARYSLGGGGRSGEMPVIAIFDKLVKDRYDGDVTLEYRFDCEEIPTVATLMAEGAEPAEVNGVSVTPVEPWSRDKSFLRADITGLIRRGENIIRRTTRFHQREEVYYALFGEGVTETLRNRLTYDSELEALYICGDFGVGAGEITGTGEEGVYIVREPYITRAAKEWSNPVAGGYPFFSGRITLRKTLDLPSAEGVLIAAPPAAKVYVNGQYAGSSLLDPLVDVSRYAVPGKNEITLEVFTSPRNLFGPHHTGGDPKSVSPTTFRNNKDADGYAVVDFCRREMP